MARAGAAPAANSVATQPATNERASDPRDEAVPTAVRSSQSAQDDGPPAPQAHAPQAPAPEPASSTPSAAFRAALNAAIAEEAAHTARIAELQAEIESVSTRRDEVAGVARSLRGYLGEAGGKGG